MSERGNECDAGHLPLGVSSDKKRLSAAAQCSINRGPVDRLVFPPSHWLSYLRCQRNTRLGITVNLDPSACHTRAHTYTHTRTMHTAPC
jgi:hypothetical protein